MPDRIATLPETSGTVRILSDLHLGHDRSAVARVESLRPLIAGAESMIFNGDTFQERSQSFRVRADAQLEELGEVCRDEGVQPYFLCGNHDPRRWDLDVVKLCHGRVVVTHGDLWMPDVSPWSRDLRECLPELRAVQREYSPADWQDLSRRIEMLERCRLVFPPAERLREPPAGLARLRLLGREFWPPRRPWEVMKAYWRLPTLASDFAASFFPDSQVMVFGHTHRAHWWRRGGRLLIDTGGFVLFAQPMMVEIQGKILTGHRVAQCGGAWRKQSPVLREVLP